MATLERLIEVVINVIDDPSVSEDEIIELFNDALDEAAQRVLLPVLEQSDIVSTVVDATSNTAPADFHRNLYGCAVEGQNPPKILSSMGLLQKRYPNVGVDNEVDDTIKFICLVAGELYYHPVPEAATDILIRYYKSPEPLVRGTDVPLEIPSHLHRKLLASYVCRELFDIIEDGMEGAKVNTGRYDQKYKAALAELKGLYTQGQSRPVPARDQNQWE